MTGLIVPQAVGRNIARAKSLLRRDEPIRALEALISGLEAYHPAELMGKTRFEVEVLVQECVNELNRQPKVRALLEALGRPAGAGLAYMPGKEDALKAVLPILYKALQETELAKVREAEAEQLGRRNSLRDKGVAYFTAGDAPRGKAALRVLGDEFGEEPGVLLEIGRIFLEHKLFFEAAEFLERALEAFPKEGQAYAGAAESYLALRELEKAETVYLKAIWEFGKHPKTMLNLARLYAQWNKKDKAFEAAQDVLRKEPENAEAKEMVAKFG